MHRSKLCAALVDVPEDAFDDTVRFWAAALGVTEPETSPQNPEFVGLGWVTPGVELMIQRVGAPARVHLDIETDDVDAEVARLQALGATEVQRVKTWVVMRDPAGLLFCVVRPQSPDFPAGAKEWP